ncbi:MAG: ATP-binding cassette domain-containing protein [Acidimicrobiia bacterium]|nr:ATP-binding cassette domain-containing protein [Acidimicrobiia bacterium]MYG58515.1 ATP-binding cassette domain-containing protein [Acidimicrobiia bacterium]MYJ33764.1 ATP-binding cassette domain-containing protein [Acidimicrobiia bacterium]
MGTQGPTSALRLVGVGFTRDKRPILSDVDWEVACDQRWVVLGANGSGKTSLLRIAALYEHPTTGTVEVLGHRLGQVDVRRLRHQVGFVSPALAQMLRPHLKAVDVVMTARHGALEPWWHEYTDADRQRAVELLEQVGAEELGERTIATLSSGERQRVQIARSLMTDPGLVLLDEPASTLDLGGREMLVTDLTRLAADPSAPPMVMVTHRTEEIPAGFTHGLILRDGRVLAQGPLEDVLTSDSLSACFDLPLKLEHHNGRWHAQAR